MKEEKQRKLQERRERLRSMLQEERDQLEAELKNVLPDRATQARELVEKTDALRSAREERRKNVWLLIKTTAVSQIILILGSMSDLKC